MEAERKTRRALDPDAEIGLNAARVADRPCCAWPGCSASGTYRAPQSTRELRCFIWFCLEHIREYNQRWNYFAGMNEHEIEAHRRADTTWHRPSWRFGAASIDQTSYFRDPFGFFTNGELGDDPKKSHTRNGTNGRGLGKGAEMMAVLQLDPGFTLDDLKRRYKTMVKRHHPDLHGGDRAAEEQLKTINEAYSYLIANRLYR